MQYKLMAIGLIWGFFWLNEAKAEVWQKTNDLEKLLKELQTYTDTHIVPVMKIQRKKLHKYLTISDLKAIDELSRQKYELENRKKIFLKDPKASADWRMREWEAIQQAHTEISLGLQTLADNYEKIIQQLFAEIADKINFWRAEMNQIVEKYNQLLDENQTRPFKKYGFGEFMQPEGFVGWNPDLQLKPAEGQADDGIDD
ncbi:MAG: hypothetical protein MUE85_19470 [Microscillaceae bacterium]|jgi:ElaB/YqjD/DUF883 family membrane-anchored ribosome-binding protein|nr:hypothetical protein [Microscillaceae bacterium]